MHVTDLTELDSFCIHKKYLQLYVLYVRMFVCMYVCAGRLGTKKILTGLHSDAANKLLNWL